MKKLIICLTIFLTLLSAQDKDTERKIYETIIKTVFPNKKTVYVWTDNSNKFKALLQIPFVKVVKNKKEADFLIISKFDKNLPEDKIIFADGYLVFKQLKRKIIGGFYWQKGRPNIVFIKKNIDKNNLNLPKNFSKYLE